jgi:hypothetical protein
VTGGHELVERVQPPDKCKQVTLNTFDIQTFTTRGPDGTSPPEKADAQ